MTERPERDNADHAADDDAPEALDEAGERGDVLLDEGVEETFPASDPVAVKHIT